MMKNVITFLLFYDISCEFMRRWIGNDLFFWIFDINENLSNMKSLGVNDDKKNRRVYYHLHLLLPHKSSHERV